MDHHPDLDVPVGRRPGGSVYFRRQSVGTRCYHADVAVRKLSIALEESVAAAAAESAVRHGLSLSAWVNAAAERALLVEAGLAAVGEWEAEHDSLTTEELAWADSVLDGVSDRG